MPNHLSLMRTRDARDDPPPADAIVMTDQGPGQFGGITRRWWKPRTGELLEPQPTQWFDLEPSDGDALMPEHVRVLLEAAEYVLKEHPVDTEPDLLAEAAARLRRATEPHA